MGMGGGRGLEITHTLFYICQICDGLLEKCHRLESVMLVLQFILGHLDQLHSAKQLKLANQLLGVKALLVLPHFVREQYRPLMGEPLLIIEQLLIDLKVYRGQVCIVIIIGMSLSEPILASQPVFCLIYTTIHLTVIAPRGTGSYSLMLYPIFMCMNMPMWPTCFNTTLPMLN